MCQATTLNYLDTDQQAGLFHYYSLGGDTAMPDGLYARLYHAFLVVERAV